MTTNDHHRRTLLAPTTGRVPHTTAIVSAWITLKQARGQSVYLDRIGTPHHLIARRQSALLDDLDERNERIKSFVRDLRARAAAQPSGGVGA
ncbi:hypothetical protein [Pseudosulfitobacter pseudonitzschiae]|uniref:hypothetical protein n=1 Tax=Pseudosulfitobacter pseudonitzschiae TaxID=1402135 RepID=UPI003B7E2832